MPDRQLPVRPDLTQLKHQAKDLLRELRRADPSAKLADAQHTLATSYGADSWPRLVRCCRLIDAIWQDDAKTVRELVLAHPNLLIENAGIRNNNWGPPLSYAANLGRDRIIAMLHELGAADLEHGLDRAVLQGRIDTAKQLHRMLGSPKPPRGALGNPAYTLSVEGTRFLFDIGAEMLDEEGRPDAPVDVVLESDGRKPAAKHGILEMYAAHGFELPDTPMMALHRGRIDLLEAHLARDPSLLARTFAWDEIYPSALKCRPVGPGGDEHLPRTPINGGTLLHVAVEYDELEIARWLLDRGMSPDAPAAIDSEGFGGHTALFNAVVSYPHFWMNYTGGWAHSRKPLGADFARLLLDRGANPDARASLRHPKHSARNVTALEWGRGFPGRLVVSEPALELLARAARGLQ